MVTQVAQIKYRPNDLKEWQKIYPGDGSASADDLCAQALAGFGKFSAQFSAYFDEVIQHKDFDHTHITAAHLRTQANQALNEYWKPLGEVLTQRQVAFYRELFDREATPRSQTYLNLLGREHAGALVYFNKVATIHYVPYTPIAFIGTPYMMLDQNDWMGIAHEAGHVAYWNLGKDFQTVRTQQENLKRAMKTHVRRVVQGQELREERRGNAEKILLNWLEETFCDVVGTRLAQAEFVQSLQSVITQSANQASDLTTDDGRHPPYALRPLVRELTLSLSGEKPAVDWDKFFLERFNVRSIRKQTISILSTERQDLDRLRKSELLSILANKTTHPRKSIRTQKLPVETLIPALETMVKCLNEQVDAILKNGLPARSAQVDPFDQLLDIAKHDKRKNQRIYELLLQPHILEGGDDHGPHDALGHLQWHALGPHKH